MPHSTSTKASIQIITINDSATLTEHHNGTYVQMRELIARHIAANGLFRFAYGDSGQLFCDGMSVGHYIISRAAL